MFSVTAVWMARTMFLRIWGVEHPGKYVLVMVARRLGWWFRREEEGEVALRRWDSTGVFPPPHHSGRTDRNQTETRREQKMAGKVRRVKTKH
jgi:hypothetical protein